MSELLPPFPVDIAKLLLPLSEDKPAGEWLRYEGTYDLIEQARKEDDASLPQGIWKTLAKRANWDEVARLCQTALRESSKDLQIAAWLMEAWLVKYGWRSLVPGLELVNGLCASFWETVYPTLDEGDAAYRLAPIEWIDRKLIMQIKRLPVTDPTNEDTRSYSYAEWEQAQHYERLRQKGERDVEGGDVMESRILSSGAMTPHSFFVDLLAIIDAASAAAEELSTLLDQRVGEELGSLRGLRTTLREARGVIVQLAGGREATAAEEDTDAGEGEGGESEGASAQAGGRAGGRRGINSRAEAYRALQEAADYLLRTEPHSPTPYLVKRAVSWGGKGLAELLAEIVGTPQDLKAIFQLLAIRAPESE